jgi:molybdopterin converting factor small subunit
VTVTVLLFASYADALGSSSVDVQLPAGATVSDLLTRIANLPGANKLPPRPLVAVNRSYAGPGRELLTGDEVALIPPVAGG